MCHTGSLCVAEKNGEVQERIKKAIESDGLWKCSVYSGEEA